MNKDTGKSYSCVLGDRCKKLKERNSELLGKLYSEMEISNSLRMDLSESMALLSEAYRSTSAGILFDGKWAKKAESLIKRQEKRVEWLSELINKGEFNARK